MEEREYLITLFEYYGNLLTDKQQLFFKDYYYDNLTMEEISINYEISKNAVSKQLITIKEKLYYFEDILKLKFKHDKIINVLDKKILDSIIEYI